MAGSSMRLNSLRPRSPAEIADTERLRDVLTRVKALGAEYYRLTGKPLGVTGEVAELVAADLFKLDLAPPRTRGYDATRTDAGRLIRIQIKGRALGPAPIVGHRVGSIKTTDCDVVMLVLLDNATLQPREVWEAEIGAVMDRLRVEGSIARSRGSLSIREFKNLKGSRRIWPLEVEAR